MPKALDDSVQVIAVVIPCFRVKRHVIALIQSIGAEVQQIVVVDDACPEKTGEHVSLHCHDPRVVVLTHAQNQGVGGAVVTGYVQAVEAGATVVVKLDGDGQMDPSLIPEFIDPIIKRRADYTKGNRFYNLADVRNMPFLRLVGNAALSFTTKISSGYWGVFDPTNGYTAISSAAIAHLPLQKLSRRYFFESDLLFRLSTLRARVLDIPMTAVYGDEVSGLQVSRVLLPFVVGNTRNLIKRVFYSYFLRDFSLATLQLLVGLTLLIFGVAFGSVAWASSARTGMTASTGTVMLAALPIILGVQLLLSFISYDMASVPTEPAFPLSARRRFRRPDVLPALAPSPDLTV